MNGTLNVLVDAGHTLQVRLDGSLVPGLNLTGTGGNQGILRLRNAIEIWPNDAGTSQGKLDVRDTAGNAQVQLFGDGSVFKPGGGSWGVLSDVRLKHDVADLTGSLDRLLALRSVTFDYNDPVRDGAGRQTGFIAQEAEKVFPEWVGEKADGTKYIAVKGFEAQTVEALRELRAEKDAEIKKVRAENAALRERLERLEALIVK